MIRRKRYIKSKTNFLKKGPRKLLKGPQKPLRRTKSKKTKIALFREWGVPDAAYRRYSGIKGVYWYWFSKEIRARDYALFEGKCMTCLEYVDPKDSQCGHLFAARDCGFTLLFHPKNNHLQHSSCNNPRFTPSAGIHNAINIEQRYGSGTIAELAQLKSLKGKEWSKSGYAVKIAELESYQQAKALLKE